MKQLLELALVALAISLIGASTASATTLETSGVKKSEPISLEWSLKGETSTLLLDTSNAFLGRCTASTVAGKDSTSATGTTVSGPLTTLSFSGCTTEKVVTDLTGTFSIEWIKGTTNGTVRWSGNRWTVPFNFFGTVVVATCQTENTDMGTLKGTGSGSATLEINAVVNCGSVLPSAKWQATYTTTTSGGVGHAIGVVE